MSFAESTDVENSKNHLSYLTLYDAAYEHKWLSPEEWGHVHECDDCTLLLAHIIQVRNDLDELRKKYSA
jgi:hypothetical protein